MDARMDRFRPTLILLSRSDVPHAVPPARPPEWAALMPFTVDDRFFSHPKILAAELDERGLFVTVGTWTRDHASSGVVPRHVLTSFGCTPDVESRLVGHGLWRRVRGGVAFNDWDYWNAPAASPAITQAPAVPDDVAPSTAPQAPAARARTAGARKQALSRSGIKRAVRERDGDRCRYCATAVRWGVGRAPDSAAYDFTDPGGPAEAANVVVACAACHSSKGDRTAEEAGVKVLPVPACTPSDLQVSARTRSCTPSTGTRTPSRTPYGDETPAQKGYAACTPSPLSDLDSDQSLGLGQSVSHQVEDRNAGGRAKGKPREPKPATAEFRIQVQGGMAARHHDDVADDEADALAADVLGRAKGPVPHKLGYVLKAIEDEKDPYGRWLSHRKQRRQSAELTLRPWCGRCREADRGTYDELDRFIRCPDCFGYAPRYQEAS